MAVHYRHNSLRENLLLVDSAVMLYPGSLEASEIVTAVHTQRERMSDYTHFYQLQGQIVPFKAMVKHDYTKEQYSSVALVSI